ncbi:helix-turn-helix domain-containing protein [Paucibacter sp. O1-1]|nr:helix-turn-helix domain-containing protein [Paucibacter sp. O1-1]MDA3827821.1 helix-turn-helix domain-containing protein [Paucibacter sp. O1-1]
METKFSLAIASSGGTTLVAAKLGESPQTLNNWVSRGVPVPRCAAVEAATACAVMRWDLRPDDWHLIWPELIGADGAPAIPAEQGA